MIPRAAAGVTRVGWIGTGVMGAHMARHIYGAGYTSLTVYNRTAAKAQPLHCKMANQVTIASSMLGMCEGLLYAHKAGLDLEAYLGAIRGGGAGSFSIESYAPRVLGRDMAPGFYVRHFVKDLGIALGECQRLNIALPGLALAQQLYVSLCAVGEGDLGTQALIKSLERLNGTELPKVEVTKW
eukprot:contig_23436_g5780